MSNFASGSLLALASVFTYVVVVLIVGSMATSCGMHETVSQLVANEPRIEIVGEYRCVLYGSSGIWCERNEP